MRCTARAAAAWRLGVALIAAGPACVAAPAGVYLEAMTSPELRERIAAGATTALVPIGGTEQNGAHLVLGKHNVRVHVLAGRIAERLGQAVVAPVLAYVPEGRIDPPTEHMRWAGTISIPEAAFEAVLEGTAASLCRHGLREVVFLGDHGGYQAAMARAAKRFDKGGGQACRVLALDAYYQASQRGFAAWLAQQGFGAAEIGSHAGLADTALSLAVDPAGVRPALQARGASDGVRGDPRRATAELGAAGVERIVTDSVAALQAWQARR